MSIKRYFAYDWEHDDEGSLVEYTDHISEMKRLRHLLIESFMAGDILPAETKKAIDLEAKIWNATR